MRQVTGQSDGSSYGYMFAFVSSLSAGTAIVVAKWNLESITPLLMNAGIFLVGATVLVLSVLLSHRRKLALSHSPAGWGWIGAITATSLLAVFSFWTGVQKMDPSLAAFLARSEVPIAIFLGVLFLKERFNVYETMGAVLSFSGIVIMKMTIRVEYTDGFWWVLAGATFFGVTEFVSKKAVRHVEPVTLTTIRNVFMATVFWIVFVTVDGDTEGIDVVWPGVLALGMLGPIVSRVAYLSALRRLELSKVAIISQSQPVFVLLIALLVFGQLPTFREFTGGLCLMIGSLMMILGRTRFRRRLTVAEVSD